MLHEDITVIRQISPRIYERKARRKLCIANTCQGGQAEYRLKGWDEKQNLYGSDLTEFRLIMKY